VRGEDELLRLHDKLKHFQVDHVLIREPDMDDQATAIGVHPRPRGEVRRHFSRYNLLR